MLNGVLLVNWNVTNKMQQELDKVCEKSLEFNAKLGKWNLASPQVQGHITFHTSDPKLLKDNNLLPLKHKGQTQEKAVAKVNI